MSFENYLKENNKATNIIEPKNLTPEQTKFIKSHSTNNDEESNFEHVCIMESGTAGQQEIEEQLRKEDKILVVIGKSNVRTLYALSISKWRFIRYLIKTCGSDGESLREIRNNFIRQPCAFCYNYFEIDDSEDEACELCKISPGICDDDGKAGIIAKFAKAQSQDDFQEVCNQMLRTLRLPLRLHLRESVKMKKVKK